jgi:hypothetical protein
MNSEKLTRIRTNELGFTTLEMAFHLDMSILDYTHIETGEYELSFRELSLVSTLVSKYKIPNINDTYVMDIVKNPNLNLSQKSQKIAKCDYNEACKRSNKPVDRSKLMSDETILRHLENRIEGDID